MSELITGSVAVDTVAKQGSGLDAQLKELYSLSAEIVDLFHTQIFSPETINTPADVCSAFSDMILSHWDLCCIVVYLRDEDGHLRESAIHTHQHFDEGKAREVSAQFAAAVEQEDHELQAWLDEGDAAGNGKGTSYLRHTLEDMGLRAGVAVPIHARGTLVGALIAITVFPERLRAALNGIRFLAAPVVVGIGNARRAAAMREQHQRIEQLVEQLQQRSHALEEANRELRHVAHYRSLFLGRMSHELRTPLTSILGFAEILLDYEELSENQRRFCEKIQSSGLQLQTSLNQLVDLSRIEAGQSELLLHEFSLRDVLNESCKAVDSLAHKQSVKIDCVPEDNLTTIVSDEGKLRQVLYNFFANAISRSPEDETVSVRAESLPPSRLQIIIKDQGKLPTDISHIFEPVEISGPSESAATMNELGLVISRRLIELLGGSVMAEGLQPRGLKVVIELPVRPTEVR
ncbi:MAG: two-component system, NarL family, sensor histidine kinase BarA [Acidobacteriota bacterium]|jgi:signal transduction histidine kinase|nr:two-component system, NarL family, sensor histidine kinase BarA [Acidobacteriota bacterium]